MFIKRFILTVSATWIFVLIYYIHKIVNLDTDIYKFCMNYGKKNLIICIILCAGTLIMVISPIIISKMKTRDEIRDAQLVELVDNSFIPTYLGYFFVSMSVDNFKAMVVFYLIIVLFTFFSGIEYFNSLFLFMGYHIYKVESAQGVQNIIILKSQNVVRKSQDLQNLKLYRINNMTYIGKKE